MRFQEITRDSLPHITGCVVRLICGLFSTWRGRCLAWWWSVPVGRATRFNGRPVFRRLPRSRISIGGGCIFTSATPYNVIGVNHPCILATLSPEAEISVGEGCGFSGTAIGCQRRVAIGNNVRCGANTVIMDTDWHTDDPRTSPPEAVVIEDDVWLGLNVTVLKGSVIGRGSIIAAGSVVTHSIPAGVVAAGVPARVIRSLKEGAAAPVGRP